jgi:hypothetical protein
MDRILDALEGRPDSLPEQWIDDLEAIESDFATWVVEADKCKVHNEWLRSKAESEMAAMRAADLQRAESLKEEGQDPTPDTAVSGPSNYLPSAEESTVEPERGIQCGLSSDDARPTSPQYVEQSTVPVEEAPLPTDCVEGNSSPNLKLSISLPKPPIEEKQEDLTPVAVAEDIDTPTQSDFPPASAISRQLFSTPEHTSCAIDSNLENKENIPPPGFQQPDAAVSPPGQPSTKPSPLSENKALAEDPLLQHSATPEMEDQHPEPVSVGVTAAKELHPSPSLKDLPRDTVPDDIETKPGDEEKQPTPHSNPTEPIPEPKPISSSVDQDSKSPNRPSEPNQFDTPVAATVSPVFTPSRSDIRVPKSRPSGRASQIPMAVASPKSGSNHTPVKSHPPSNEGTAEPYQRTVRKPLQSPIKLSKSRSGKVLDKDGKAAHKITHRRRTSTGSVGSLLSDHSSLISSPEALEPRTASSNGTPVGTASHPKSIPPPSHGAYTLREDRLRHLENQKPDPRISFQQSRTVSLPLERFINERLELGLGSESAPGVASVNPSRTRTRSVTSADFPKPPKVCEPIVCLIICSSLIVYQRQEPKSHSRILLLQLSHRFHVSLLVTINCPGESLQVT